MKISCEEASNICNRSQYKEAGSWELFKLRVHILMCRTCAKFTKQNTMLTSLCDRANLNTLSESDKESMRKDLKKHL
ncbi:hypothetical protein FVB32_09110 [Flagellimonas hymeniacidonis]|uniref:Glycine dehydrogenase n=1 Tax=Flagellimonas hymeniacidonis TaxID=2603628 RepID=A0A5C8V0U5_9FLAO|nr:hypothetical protein [Flagellimonas hymeniacidonis]TXN34752.1 hypothetical protein FVB32_09110 [Flagellimonas hymeniacidonis]